MILPFYTCSKANCKRLDFTQYKATIDWFSVMCKPLVNSNKPWCRMRFVCLKIKTQLKKGLMCYHVNFHIHQKSTLDDISRKWIYQNDPNCWGHLRALWRVLKVIKFKACVHYFSFFSPNDSPEIFMKSVFYFI